MSIIPKNNQVDFPLSTDLQEILYYASLAPSTHNTQMWIVEIDEINQQIAIRVDSQRTLPEIDPTHREAYLSAGAFLENLEQAFFAYHYRVTVEIKTTIAGDNPIIAIVSFTKLTTNENKKNHPLALMLKRHAEKRHFSDIPLESEVVSKLILGSPYLHYYPKNSKNYQYIKQNAILALMTHLDNLSKRTEIAKWLRFSDKQTKEMADGISAELLGLTGISKFFYYRKMDEEKAINDMFVKQSVELFKKQLEHCMGFFVVTGDNIPCLWVQTGMQMEAFWLKATDMKIALHPLSELLAESPFKETIQHDLNLTKPVQMIFRAGYIKRYGKNYKIRRPLKQFVFQKGI